MLEVHWFGDIHVYVDLYAYGEVNIRLCDAFNSMDMNINYKKTSVVEFDMKSRMSNYKP